MSSLLFYVDPLVAYVEERLSLMSRARARVYIRPPMSWVLPIVVRSGGCNFE